MTPNVELTGPLRRDGLARVGKMYRVPQTGPRRPAVEGPVERCGYASRHGPGTKATGVGCRWKGGEPNRPIAGEVSGPGGEQRSLAQATRAALQPRRTMDGMRAQGEA